VGVKEKKTRNFLIENDKDFDTRDLSNDANPNLIKISKLILFNKY